MLTTIAEPESELTTVVSTQTEQETTSESNPENGNGAYDPRKRDPQFAKSETTCMWELVLLKEHYHPSVVRWVKEILDGKEKCANNQNKTKHHKQTS